MITFFNKDIHSILFVLAWNLADINAVVANYRKLLKTKLLV